MFDKRILGTSSERLWHSAFVRGLCEVRGGKVGTTSLLSVLLGIPTGKCEYRSMDGQLDRYKKR